MARLGIKYSKNTFLVLDELTTCFDKPKPKHTHTHHTHPNTHHHNTHTHTHTLNNNHLLYNKYTSSVS